MQFSLLGHPHSLLNNQTSAILASLTAHFLCQCHLSEAGLPNNMSVSPRMKEHGCKQIQYSVTFWSIRVRDKCLHAVLRKWCVNNAVWLTYLDKPGIGVHAVQYMVCCWIDSTAWKCCLYCLMSTVINKILIPKNMQCNVKQRDHKLSLWTAGMKEKVWQEKIWIVLYSFDTVWMSLFSLNK